jgi:hypothetical protein
MLTVSVNRLEDFHCILTDSLHVIESYRPPAISANPYMSPSLSGYGGGVNLSGLDMGGSVMGGPGGMKDMGGQQSRFKWMMEGHSPAPSLPESLHKNGESERPYSVVSVLN